MTPSVIRLKGSLLKKAEIFNSLGCERIHFDLSSGKTFPEFFSIDRFFVKERDLFDSAIDFHVFLKKPRKINLPLKKRDRIIFHIFPGMNHKRMIEEIRILKKKNIKVGIAADLETPFREVGRYFGLIDVFLVMGIPAGQKKVPLHPKTISFIVRARKDFASRGREPVIGIDGGISGETFSRIAPLVKFIVVGSLLFETNNIGLRWKKLNLSLQENQYAL